MFTKTMKFDDLDGNEVEQTFYFNYTKKEVAELLEFGCLLEFADPKKTYLPLEEQLKILQTPMEESGLSNTENNKVAYEIFQNLVLDAYGEKAADNRGFDKSTELRRYWKNHVAFVELIFEFIEDTSQATLFIEKCLPPKFIQAAKEELASSSGVKVSKDSLHEMILEADRRQQDPETRIEPGVIPEDADPAVLKLAESIKENDGEVKAKLISDLTEEDIMTMPQEQFDKLDVKQLNREQMMAAFKRKTQS